MRIVATDGTVINIDRLGFWKLRETDSHVWLSTGASGDASSCKLLSLEDFSEVARNLYAEMGLSILAAAVTEIHGRIPLEDGEIMSESDSCEHEDGEPSFFLDVLDVVKYLQT
jgi:hypothetical protein